MPQRENFESVQAFQEQMQALGRAVDNTPQLSWYKKTANFILDRMGLSPAVEEIPEPEPSIPENVTSLDEYRQKREAG